MKWKKNWFAYFVWAVYSIALCLILAIYINWQCSLQHINKYAVIGLICLTPLVSFGVFCLLGLLYKKGMAGRQPGRHSSLMLEVFLVLSLFAGAVLVRVYGYLYTYGGVYTGSLEFYEMATVKAGGEVPFIRHGAAYFYTGILSLLFSFFGNKLSAAVVLQIVLQLLGILCFYFAVRNLVGKKEAVISLGIMSFYNAVVSNNFSLTAENLYFFLFAGMLLLLSVYMHYEKKGRKTWLVMVSLVFLGIGAGYLVYLDVAGLLFLLAIWYVILSKKRKKGKNTAYICFAVGGFLCGFFGLLALETGITGELFEDMVLSWCRLYFDGFAWNCAVAGPDTTIAGNIGCLVLAGFVSFAFFRKDEDDSGLYMLSLVLLAIFVSFGKANVSYQLLVTSYWSVLAAIGVMSVKKEKTIKIATDEQLSLPKKHVKKTMDYRFEPEEKLMKYDLEIPDIDDDFDLR